MVPVRVAGFTCAAAALAKKNITAYSTKYTRIRILRCMSPPGLITEVPLPLADQRQELKKRHNTHSGRLWIWLPREFCCWCVFAENHMPAAMRCQAGSQGCWAY